MTYTLSRKLTTTSLILAVHPLLIREHLQRLLKLAQLPGLPKSLSSNCNRPRGKSELKQRQIKELAKLEKTRGELGSKRSQAELEEKLQDLGNEAECMQYKAELLAVDEQLENETLSGSSDQRLNLKNLKNEIPELPMEENVTLVNQRAYISTPNQRNSKDISLSHRNPERRSKSQRGGTGKP